MSESVVVPSPSLSVEAPPLPDKRQVAASFSRAAASYDSVAELQRAVGGALLDSLPDGFVPERWLDLGCGTGHFSRVLAERFPTADGLALDIAEGMLQHARPLGGPATSPPATPSACLLWTVAWTWCSAAWRCSGAVISRRC